MPNTKISSSRRCCCRVMPPEGLEAVREKATQNSSYLWLTEAEQPAPVA